MIKYVQDACSRKKSIFVFNVKNEFSIHLLRGGLTVVTVAITASLKSSIPSHFTNQCSDHYGVMTKKKNK